MRLKQQDTYIVIPRRCSITTDTFNYLKTTLASNGSFHASKIGVVDGYLEASVEICPNLINFELGIEVPDLISLTYGLYNTISDSYKIHSIE